MPPPSRRHGATGWLVSAANSVCSRARHALTLEDVIAAYGPGISAVWHKGRRTILELSNRCNIIKTHHQNLVSLHVLILPGPYPYAGSPSSPNLHLPLLLPASVYHKESALLRVAPPFGGSFLILLSSFSSASLAVPSLPSDAAPPNLEHTKLVRMVYIVVR